MYLVSHFLNEEILLPHWLRHHAPLFDHGIMIDYGSTDRSVEIIHELAPHWEVRKTRNQKFAEPMIGNEVEDIERSLPSGSWKLVLNTTEFLVCQDFRAFIQNFEKDFPHLPGFRTTGVIMIDSTEEEQLEITNSPLVLQRRHGVVERRGEPNLITWGFTPSRCRFVHKMPAGKYAIGRHLLSPEINLHDIDLAFGVSDDWNPRYDLPTKTCWSWMKDRKVDQPSRLTWHGVYPGGIYVLWFGRYSPFTKLYRQRVAIRDFQYRGRDALGAKVYGTVESETDTSVLEQQIAMVRDLSSDLWETEPLLKSALGV